MFECEKCWGLGELEGNTRRDDDRRRHRVARPLDASFRAAACSSLGWSPPARGSVRTNENTILSAFPDLDTRWDGFAARGALGAGRRDHPARRCRVVAPRGGRIRGEFVRMHRRFYASMPITPKCRPDHVLPATARVSRHRERRAQSREIASAESRDLSERTECRESATIHTECRQPSSIRRRSRATDDPHASRGESSADRHSLVARYVHA